ncbi:hypothetical protein Ocin01_19732, partial [Orchesella cincta]
DTTSLKVLAADTKSQADGLRFVLFNPNDLRKDIMGLNHVGHVLSLNLELVTGSGYKCDVKLNCKKLTQASPQTLLGEASLESPKYARYIVYHGLLIERILNGVVSWLSFCGFELYPESVLTPFTLLDREGNKHACHKEVLEDQCQFFLKHMEANPNTTELVVLGSCTTVDLLLQHLYHPRTQFLLLQHLNCL